MQSATDQTKVFGVSPNAPARLIIESRDLDTDERTLSCYPVGVAARSSVALRDSIVGAMAHAQPDARLRSFADGVATFVAPQHLYVVRAED